MKTTIKIEPSVTYLSEVMQTLPKNCLFDKGRVGCGGTTITIESNEAYVICVPYVSLIENKVAQYPNERYTGDICGVCAGVTNEDIAVYMASTPVPKFMVTYDSLARLTNIINPQDFKLLVDEYHILFTAYSYRSEAAQSVLQNYTKYKEYCFMTATPLEEEFILDELKDLDVVEAIWENTYLAHIESVHCQKGVKEATKSLIFSFLSGATPGNAYIFVNSIKFINEIIQACRLTADDTRVIYSTHNEEAKRKVSIPNGRTIDAPKKINLLTSCVFEGQDIYDEDGRIIMVSDATMSHTLLDISTSFQQIIGRIRNSKYATNVMHLYSQTRYSDVTYEEFLERTNQLVENYRQSETIYNSLPQFQFDIMYNKMDINDTYLDKRDGKFYFDPNKAKIDMFQFKVARNMYTARVNIVAEYAKFGYNSSEHIENTISIADISAVKGKPLKEVIAEIQVEMEDRFRIDFPVRDAAFLKYRFLEKAITKLGFEKIAALGYVQKAIKDELAFVSDKSIGNKIMKLLKNEGIGNGDFVPAAKLKKIFTNIYTKLEINKKATAATTLEYYDAKENSRRIDGKVIKGYTIIRPLIIFKNN